MKFVTKLCGYMVHGYKEFEYIITKQGNERESLGMYDPRSLQDEIEQKD